MKKSWLSRISLSFSYLIVHMPQAVQFAIGDIIGILWFDVIRVRRNIVLSNLRLAFPDWTEAERVRVGRASVCHLGRSFIEFWRLPMATAEQYSSQFIVSGVENIKIAQARGKGVFVLASHIGNGDWASMGLALNGVFLNTITKEFKWQALNNFWFETRQKFGMGLIPDRRSSLMILKILKKNGLVCFVIDQFLGPPIGVRTQFFGVETGAPMGLALLAERSGAAVVPALTYRDKEGRTVVEIEPEIPFVDTGDKDQNIKVNTQRYTDKIEEWVRRHPAQWMWVHRRWKEFRE